MTAPVAASDAPGVAVGLGAVAPQLARLGGVRAEVDRLDAGARCPAAANRGRSSGWSSWTCSMPRHERQPAGASARGRRARPGPRRRRWRGSASRSRRPRRASTSSRERRRARSSRRHGGARVASGRSGSGSMSSSSAAVRDPSEPSAKHFCQPTRARPSGSVAEDVAAAQPASMAVVEARRPACTAWTRIGRRPASARRA